MYPYDSTEFEKSKGEYCAKFGYNRMFYPRMGIITRFVHETVRNLK